MCGKAIILSLISIFGLKLSQQLFSNPDLSNPLIPLRWREMCGYRYRPKEHRITFPKPCFKHSHEDQVIYEPRRGDGPHKVATSRVLYGRDVEKREAPWAVQIAHRESNRYLWHCSGVLITMRHILTAAHCYKYEFQGCSRPDPFNVGSYEGADLGVLVGSDRPLSGQRINNLSFISHPDYNHQADKSFDSLNSDIAIIKLDEPINWETIDSQTIDADNKYFGVNTICLPQKGYIANASIYQDATFFGWGKTLNDKYPAKMQRGDLSVAKPYKKVLMFESKGLNHASCKGDSGSGLVQYLDEYETRAVLIGIVVSVDEDSRRGFSGCGRLPDGTIGKSQVIIVGEHLDWIHQQLKTV